MIVGIHIFFVTVDGIYELTVFCIELQLIPKITVKNFSNTDSWLVDSWLSLIGWIPEPYNRI